MTEEVSNQGEANESGEPGVPGEGQPITGPLPGFADGEQMRRKGKKRKPDEKMALNINSLMDIMTILLVFLLKSYSADPVQIKPAPGLQLPFARTELKPSESTSITITMSNIMVDEKKVIALESGKVNQADMAGDFLIQPLVDALSEAVEHQKKIAKFNKKSDFSGLVTIIAHRDIPFNLLTKVMYTAGQAQFGKYKFAVIKLG